jgi:hypothetical protein
MAGSLYKFSRYINIVYLAIAYLIYKFSPLVN